MPNDDARDGAGLEPAGKGPTRSGFWGRGENGRGFAQPKALEHSREDYGATDHGGEAEPDRDDAGERNPSPRGTSTASDADQEPTGR